METSSWIVKTQKPEPEIEKFEDIIAGIISLHPEWTEDDCKSWRAEKNWHIGQAKRIRLGDFVKISQTDSWNNVDEKATH